MTHSTDMKATGTILDEREQLQAVLIFFKVPHEAKASMKIGRQAKITMIRPPKETYTKPPPRCAMQGSMIEHPIYELGCSHEGKYEERKRNREKGKGRA